MDAVMELPAIQLQVAVKDGNDEVTKLTFVRWPTAADFAATDEVKGAHSGIQVLLARVCNLPLKTIKQLDGRDYMKAAEAINHFLEPDQKTGETSSET